MTKIGESGITWQAYGWPWIIGCLIIIGVFSGLGSVLIGQAEKPLPTPRPATLPSYTFIPGHNVYKLLDGLNCIYIVSRNGDSSSPAVAVAPCK